ncbi:MAG TPA: hypothetical protein PLV52_05715, partial [Candidatus Omnitrophota bacterium]|nr:hypothetical protein [Candidatus Omnitrophota bacterium]
KNGPGTTGTLGILLAAMLASGSALAEGATSIDIWSVKFVMTLVTSAFLGASIGALAAFLFLGLPLMAKRSFSQIKTGDISPRNASVVIPAQQTADRIPPLDRTYENMPTLIDGTELDRLDEARKAAVENLTGIMQSGEGDIEKAIDELRAIDLAIDQLFEDESNIIRNTDDPSASLRAGEIRNTIEGPGIKGTLGILLAAMLAMGGVWAGESVKELAASHANVFISGFNVIKNFIFNHYIIVGLLIVFGFFIAIAIHDSDFVHKQRGEIKELHLYANEYTIGPAMGQSGVGYMEGESHNRSLGDAWVIEGSEGEKAFYAQYNIPDRDEGIVSIVVRISVEETKWVKPGGVPQGNTSAGEREDRDEGRETTMSLRGPEGRSNLKEIASSPDDKTIAPRNDEGIGDVPQMDTTAEERTINKIGTDTDSNPPAPADDSSRSMINDERLPAEADLDQAQSQAKAGSTNKGPGPTGTIGILLAAMLASGSVVAETAGPLTESVQPVIFNLSFAALKNFILNHYVIFGFSALLAILTGVIIYQYIKDAVSLSGSATKSSDIIELSLRMRHLVAMEYTVSNTAWEVAEDIKPGSPEIETADIWVLAGSAEEQAF